MDRNFLLTFKVDGVSDFAWFETEEEMREYIERIELKSDDIFEMVEVERVREI